MGPFAIKGDESCPGQGYAATDRGAQRMADLSAWIQQLPNGKYILASWVPCACEWYAVGVWTPEGHPVTAGTVEGLAKKCSVPLYATIEEARRALDALDGE